jgi:4-amino-4-deoxy-L-arabinose transferase-like glycosyltransferase
MSAPQFPDKLPNGAALGMIAVLTIIAAALRLYDLNSELWYDEIKTVLESVRPPLSVTLTDFPSNNDHPFFSLLSHLSTAVFGEQPWTVRLPAALFAIATVPMLYLFGKDAAGRIEALLAAALLTVSYHHIWFAQSARGYTMLLFFTLLTSWLLLKAIRSPDRKIYAVYAIAAALGCYTHLTMVYVVAGHALIVGVRLIAGMKGKFDVRPFLTPLFGFSLFALLTIALYLPLLTGVETYFAEKAGSTSTQVATPGWAIIAALNGIGEGFGGLVGVVLALALLAIGGLSYLWRAPTLLAIYVLPAPIVVLSAAILQHPIRPRFFFVLAGFVLLVLVRGALVAGREAARRLPAINGRRVPEMAIGIAVIAVICGLSAASLPRNYAIPKQNFTGAMAYLDSAAPAGEPVYVVGYVADVAFDDYHARSWPVLQTAEALTAVNGPFWVTYTFRDYIERGAPDMWRAITDRCAEAAAFPGTLAGGDVYVMKCRGAKQ